MKKELWEVQYRSFPAVIKYCKKCHKKTEFICTGQFRMNDQRSCLDIWLIYKCIVCNTTWNAAVYSRISSQSFNRVLLERFHKNDETLVEQYAMDSRFLRGNGVEVGLPQYSIIGDGFCLDEAIELEIRSNYSFPIKVSSIIKEKLQLTQKTFSQFMEEGRIKSIPIQDLRKCKLKKDIIVIFNEREK